MWVGVRSWAAGLPDGARLAAATHMQEAAKLKIAAKNGSDAFGLFLTESAVGGRDASVGTLALRSTLESSKRTIAMKGRGGPLGPRRGNRKAFPYEATVIAGKLLLPADVQRLHQFMLDSETVKSISNEMRLAVEALWPELVHKLPPRS